MVMTTMRSTVGFQSQRSSEISTSAPTAAVAATAPAIASGSGTNRASETASMPPSITNSPWAKLMMPVAL